MRKGGPKPPFRFGIQDIATFLFRDGAVLHSNVIPGRRIIKTRHDQVE